MPISTNLPKYTSALAALIAASALFGWGFHFESLTSVLPAWPKMVPLTAVGMILSAACVWLLVEEARRANRLAGVFSSTLLALGALMGVFHVLNWAPYPFAITPSGSEGAGSLSSIYTSALFVGVALSLKWSRSGTRIELAQSVAIAILLFAVLTSIGYLSQDTFLYQLLPGRGTSILTVVAFALLATAIFFLQPSHGIARAITDNTYHARMSRRLLALAFFMPVTFGLISVLGVQAGFFDSSTAIAFLVWGMMTIFSIVILRSALQIYRIEVMRDRAEVERRAALQELRRADERKNEFLAMLGHELRNPLAPISAAAELLEVAGAVDVGQVSRVSNIISRQVNHMVHLVDDLLDMSRVTQGMITMDMRVVDLKRIAEEAVEQVQPSIEMKGHHLELELPAESVFVQGDHKRLVQVMVNLLNNASKYTPDGGHIQLRMRRISGMAEVTVQDNGIGMNADLIPDVFGLFTQAKRTTDRSQGGLGLGLALVKKLVELHHGEVGAHSDGVGKGSTFSVTLPLYQSGTSHFEPLADDKTDSRFDSAAASQILIVDDNIDAADSLASLLRTSGHIVEVEYAPERALERVQSQNFGVSIIDIGLPRIDGNEIARRIRSLSQSRRPLLIAVSGYGQQADQQAAMAAGFDYFFVKPVSLRNLVQVLDLASRH